MGQRTGSVLCVVESPGVELGPVVAAQNFALEQKLPLAVVYCLEEQNPVRQVELLGGFRELETSLQKYNIPMMVLIGERDKVLPWMGGHVKPVRIFTEADTPEQGRLQKHPITWPGRVMTIAELQAMVSGDQSYCMPS